MARRSTRLLVLGVVRILQPVHGYDVRRELLSWRAEEWANIAPGSIYGALKTLERDGWIEIVDTGSRGARPARTTYQLTADGEKEYQQLLRDVLWEAKSPPHPLLPAVSQLPFVPRDDAMAALQARAHHLEGEVTLLERDIARIESGSDDPATDVPHHIAEMQRLSLRLVEAELNWTRDLLGRIESGDVNLWPSHPPHE
ncbi:PadR family transcriptional regulator [Phytoactinopolyspora halophila]|nr:PadR family transcriptional regulator [Phytoactinopolyspora halophila]